jgi:sterol desaturase/sphingolipid hydroxylase (fatty acid hydroxylase superfamily)
MDPFGVKVILITCLVFLPLERIIPLHPQQKIFRRNWTNDLVFLILNGLLTKLGLLAIIAATLFSAAKAVPPFFQVAVGGLPYWVQLPLAILLSDLGFYWTHRMFHAVPWLWRFHAIHHSIEELDWLAAARVHPLDQILTKGVSLVPVVALGFSEWVIVVYALLYQWQSVLIHANVRIGFGPLNWLLASPKFHHWHHSKDREARDRNFAGQLPFLDAVFGTLHMPSGRMPSSYGLDKPISQRYLLQLAYPFLRGGMPEVVSAVAVREGGEHIVSPPPDCASDVREVDRRRASTAPG